MEYTFRLELDFENKINADIISDITELKGWSEDKTWYSEIIVQEDGEWIDFISFFHKGLMNNRELLIQKFGEYEATIWYYYEYKDQCNIELSREDILKLNEMNCAICFSCWIE